MSSLKFQKAPIHLEYPYFKCKVQLFNPEQRLNIKFHIEQGQSIPIQIFPKIGVILPQQKLSLTISYPNSNIFSSHNLSFSFSLITQFSNQMYDLSSGKKLDSLKTVSLNSERRIKYQQACFIVPVIVKAKKDPLKTNVSFVNLDFQEQQKIYQQFDQISAIGKALQISKSDQSFEATQRQVHKIASNALLQGTEKAITKRLIPENTSRKSSKRAIEQKIISQQQKYKTVNVNLDLNLNRNRNSSVDFQSRQTLQSFPFSILTQKIDLKKQVNLKDQVYQNKKLDKQQSETSITIEKLQFQQTNINNQAVPVSQRLIKAVKQTRLGNSQRNLQVILLAVVAGFFFALGANLGCLVK